jgi:DNA-binding transcriptional LysR family regulator
VGNGSGIEDLRLGDLTTFLAVRRAGSVTHAARALRVTPSQVSKAIARLEAALRTRLLTRGARGVALSEAGHRVAPQVEDAVARLRSLNGTESTADREITIAAPSWLAQTVVPRVAAALGRMRVRIIELPPSLMRALVAEQIFDVALLPGDNARLPASWVTVRAGDVRKGVFASPSLARQLGPAPVPVARVRQFPFIGNVYNADGMYVSVDDDCPLARVDRIAGHEAQTFAVGLELAVRTGQLVYGPVLAARAYVARGDVVEVRVDGWDVRDALQVACDGRRVLSRVHTTTTRAVADALLTLDPTSVREDALDPHG